jgi:hypothetical protein
MTVLLAFLAACVTAGASIGQTTVARRTSHRTPVSATDLIEGDWRLWGNFASLPIAGYPITFRATGEVISNNIAAMRTWKLDRQRLKIFDAEGKLIYSLKLDRRRRVFYAREDTGGIHIGPAGATLMEVNRAGGRE